MTRLVHIVDDDAVVRGATSYLLSSHGYATKLYIDGNEFLRKADLRQGCVLLDLRMPEMSGLKVLEELMANYVAVPVIMLSAHADVSSAVRALKLGAADFIEKPYQESDLVVAIERALAGREREGGRAEAKAMAAARVQRLSDREKQVLRGLVAGMTNKEIARRLDLSPRTVEMHRSTMMADLEVDSAAEAIRIALAADLTPLDERKRSAAFMPAARLSPTRHGSDASSPPAARRLGAVLPPALDIIEGATDCVILLDRAQTITYLNRNAFEMIAEGRDAIGRSFWDLLPGTRETVAWEQILRASQERDSASFDFYAPDLGRWFAARARPISSGLQLSLRDLTTERAADGAVRRLDERLRLTLDASGDGAWDWDVRKGLIHISGRYAQRLAYGDAATVATLSGVERLIHPDDRERVKAAAQAHLSGTADRFACEYRIRSRRRRWQWTLDRGRVVERDPLSGSALRMVGSSIDIDPLKSAEAALSEARQRVALVQETTDAGLWDLDLRSRRFRFCRKSREMHGIPDDAPDRLDAGAWTATMHSDDVGSTLESLDLAIRTGSIFCARYRVILSGGRLGYVRSVGRIVHAGKSGPGNMVGLTVDETDRERTLQRLARLESDLVSASRGGAVGTVTASLADELNEPLTAISNYVQGLRIALSRASLADDAGLAAALDGAETSAARAGRILRRIRDEAAAARVHLQPERLADLIEEAARLAFADRERGAVRIAFDIAPEASWVLADRVLLRQLFAQFIGNAAEAMDEGGGDRMIAIRATANGKGEAEIEVSNPGRGVSLRSGEPPAGSLDSAGRMGADVRLAACRAIVDAHGGRMNAQPRTGGGTTVTFTLGRPRGPHPGRLETQLRRSAVLPVPDVLIARPEDRSLGNIQADAALAALSPARTEPPR